MVLLSCFTVLLLLGCALPALADPAAAAPLPAEGAALLPLLSQLPCAGTMLHDPAVTQPAAAPVLLINTTCNSCSGGGCVGVSFGGNCGNGRKCIIDHKCSTATGWACVCQ